MSNENTSNVWGFESLMVIAAFRYCLGRRTCMVSMCCEWLQDNWNEFPDSVKQSIHKEIDEALSRGEAGDQCDIKCWKRIREL